MKLGSKTAFGAGAASGARGGPRTGPRPRSRRPRQRRRRRRSGTRPASSSSNAGSQPRSSTASEWKCIASYCSGARRQSCTSPVQSWPVTARIGPFDAAPVQAVRPAVDDLGAAALAERPGGHRLGFAGGPASTTGRSSLPSRCDSPSPAAALGAEQQRPGRVARPGKRRAFRRPSRRGAALEARRPRSCPRRVERALEPRPDAERQRRAANTRSRRPPPATSKPGRPSGSSQSANPSPPSSPQLEISARRRRPRRRVRARPSVARPARRPGAERGRAGPRRRRRCAPAGARARASAAISIGAGSPPGSRTTVGLELGRATSHHPQPLARERREPVGVADDDVPVGAALTAFGGRRGADLVDRLGDLLAGPAEQLDRLVERRLQPVDPLALLGDPEHAAAQRRVVDGELERGRRVGSSPCRSRTRPRPARRRRGRRRPARSGRRAVPGPRARPAPSRGRWRARRRGGSPRCSRARPRRQRASSRRCRRRGWSRRHHPLAAEGAADRHHAAGEALGEQDQLRLEVPALDREHRPAAADPGLHLVGDQHPAVALAEAVRRPQNAADGITIPPSPSTGSISTPAICSGSTWWRSSTSSR